MVFNAQKAVLLFFMMTVVGAINLSAQGEKSILGGWIEVSQEGTDVTADLVLLTQNPADDYAHLCWGDRRCEDVTVLARGQSFAGDTSIFWGRYRADHEYKRFKNHQIVFDECCFGDGFTNGPSKLAYPTSIFTVVSIGNNLRAPNRSPIWQGEPLLHFKYQEPDTVLFQFYDTDTDVSYNQAQVRSVAGNLPGFVPLGREQSEPRNIFYVVNSRQEMVSNLQIPGWYIQGIAASDYNDIQSKTNMTGFLPILVDENNAPDRSGFPVWMPQFLSWTHTLPVRISEHIGPHPATIRVLDPFGKVVDETYVTDIRRLEELVLPAHLSGNVWVQWIVAGYPTRTDCVFVL